MSKEPIKKIKQPKMVEEDILNLPPVKSFTSKLYDFISGHAVLILIIVLAITIGYIFYLTKTNTNFKYVSGLEHENEKLKNIVRSVSRENEETKYKMGKLIEKNLEHQGITRPEAIATLGTTEERIDRTELDAFVEENGNDIEEMEIDDL